MHGYLAAALRRFIELLPGVVVTVLLIWLAPPKTSAEALGEVSVGVLTAMLGVMLVDNAALEAEVRNYRRDVHNLSTFLSSHLQLGSLTKSLLDVGSMDVSGDQFQRFYRDALWSIEKSYLSTFLATETSGSEGHNRLALEIQATKARVAGAIIRRIFIFANEGQLKSHLVMMKLQQDAGLEVKYLFDAEVSRNQSLAQWIKRVGALDFSIIDGHVLLRTYIATSHGKRVSIARSTVTTDPDLIKQCEFFFSLLWEESKEP